MEPYPPVRTAEDIRQIFSARGLSIAEWARQQGFSVPLVYQVLSGQRKGLRGQSHRIAVSLGLKEGLVGDISDLPFVTTNMAISRGDGATG